MAFLFEINICYIAVLFNKFVHTIQQLITKKGLLWQILFMNLEMKN
jgi:hypothetical protein